MAYSEKDKTNLINHICSYISSGMSLRNALKLEGKPNTETFYRWIDEDPDKSKRYARALEERADAKFDSIESDYMEQPERDPETGKIDTGWVQLQRLKIDAKKWELSKLMPKKYGDKLGIELEQKNIIFKGLDLSVDSESE
jgi:hypothetical protein